MDTPVPICQISGFCEWIRYDKIGKATEATIEPRETKRVIKRITRKIPRLMPSATGAIARKKPADVATPLPPLNLRNGDML